MTHTLQQTLIICLLFLTGSSMAPGEETLILNDPAYPKFNATALDQPILDVYLTDPQNDDAVFWDYDPNWEQDLPVIFQAFVDTGASGFVISHLTATGEYDTPALHLTESDYVGDYTEVGIGGSETGNVSRPLGVHVLNGVRQTGHEDNLDEFTTYGNFDLWVRQQVGFGEVQEVSGFLITNPVNIVGMPVIRQGIMIMDASGMHGEFPEYLATDLLPAGSPEPAHNLTLDLFLKNFLDDEPPPGETFPSHTSNPMFPAVTVTHAAPDSSPVGATSQWLFDTGASSSFISFGQAQEIGLIPASYPDLEAFLPDHEDAGGKVAIVGGIGDNPVTVPILNVNEIRMPTQDGFDIAWQNVDILIAEIPELADLGIEGIFGMNLLLPSVTLDSNDPGNLEPLSDISPGVFSTMTFDATDEQNVELRLFTFRLANSFASWRESHFTPEELNDPAISGPDADPDADGTPNLLEYGLGRLPKTSSREGLPASALETVEGDLYLTLTYERIDMADDLEFLVESSGDLDAWSAGETVEVSRESVGNRERVKVRDNQPLDAASRRFLRLRVKLLEEE